MSAYAIYRLPHEDHATQIRQTEGEPVELSTLTELNGRSGFVVAPFEVTDSQPILVIQGEAERVDLNRDRGSLPRRPDKKKLTLERESVFLLPKA